MSTQPVQGRYADGKPKPRWRGALHAVVTAFLCIAIVATAGLLLAGRLERRRWSLLAFLLGKVASYGASTHLHFGAFRDLPSLTRALRWDFLAIPLSIGGNSFPLARSPVEAGAVVLATAAFFGANVLCVARQMEGAVGLRTPNAGRGDGLRNAFLSIHCVLCYAHLAARRGVDGALASNVLLVIATLLLSLPVSAAHDEEPLDPRVPWHRPRVWGFHEDFHAVLLVGDFSMFLMVAGGNVGW